MRIKSITFGSAVRFNGRTEHYQTNEHGVDIEFDKGVVFLKKTGQKTVGIFTSNVKQFEPLEDEKAEDLVAPQLTSLGEVAQEIQTPDKSKTRTKKKS